MVAATSAYIGWMSASSAVVFHGTFGVPIKSETCRRLDIDPMVFQTYKTFMFLVFALYVSWLLEVPIRFSPWGIVSGLFWVPGGMATVIAVKLLGLAVAVAVGNSMLALVSFTWGIVIFQEKVDSVPVAFSAVLMMIAGFVGMSYFSTADSSVKVGSGNDAIFRPIEQCKSLEEPLLPSYYDDYKPSHLSPTRKHDDESFTTDTTLESYLSDEESESGISKSNHDRSNSQEQRSSMSSTNKDMDSSIVRMRNRKSSSFFAQRPLNLNNSQLDLSVMMNIQEADVSELMEADSVKGDVANTTRLVHKNPIKACGKELGRFQAGLMVACMGGTWGGSVMIPMKLCSANTSGTGYLVSFATGACIVQTCFWVMRLLFNAAEQRSLRKGYKALPSFHFKEMGHLGILSGCLWSIGNFFSILSVHYLGAGVGYCLVQASMLVGGMWGIFYFKEIKGRSRIFKWFLSAVVTISGIILLAYEHG